MCVECVCASCVLWGFFPPLLLKEHTWRSYVLADCAGGTLHIPEKSCSPLWVWKARKITDMRICWFKPFLPKMIKPLIGLTNSMAKTDFSSTWFLESRKPSSTLSLDHLATPASKWYFQGNFHPASIVCLVSCAWPSLSEQSLGNRSKWWESDSSDECFLKWWYI